MSFNVTTFFSRNMSQALPQLGKMSYDIKVSLVVCCHSKQGLIKPCQNFMCDCGIKVLLFVLLPVHTRHGVEQIRDLVDIIFVPC